MEKTLRSNFTLYILGQVITVTFLTLLQMTPTVYFIPFLLLMHVGILLFILSKKQFIKKSIEIKPFYTRNYVLYALYIPIFAYKLPSTWFAYDYNVTLVRVWTLAVTTLVVMASVINTLKMKKHLRM